MKHPRIDQWLAEKGLVESREKAQRLVRAGWVRVNGQVVDKPSASVDPEAAIDIKQQDRFVSRGGEKLEAAFQAFALDVRDRICLDVGASTGGFTDCLLQHGARRVIAVDVGRGQLHWRLRQDARVVILENINARYLAAEMLPEIPSLAVADVSFISLKLILPPLVRVLAVSGVIITLIKPQFEAGREQVGRGGVVRDPAVHQAVIENVRRFGEQELRLAWQGICESPIRGPAGNIEFLAYWKKDAGAT